MKIKIEATASHLSFLGDFRSSTIYPQPRITVSTTAANKNPKTTRQTTTSSGLANLVAVIISGNEPQIRYALTPSSNPVEWLERVFTPKA
jgi:hypothetical protein